MTKYMPSSWVPRLFEDDLYDAELTVWTVCLPRSVRCELLQRPRLENRPPYNSADDIISLFGEELYWDDDLELEGEPQSGMMHWEHDLAIKEQRRLSALMLLYWRKYYE